MFSVFNFIFSLALSTLSTNYITELHSKSGRRVKVCFRRCSIKLEPIQWSRLFHGLLTYTYQLWRRSSLEPARIASSHTVFLKMELAKEALGVSLHRISLLVNRYQMFHVKYCWYCVMAAVLLLTCYKPFIILEWIWEAQHKVVRYVFLDCYLICKCQVYINALAQTSYTALIPIVYNDNEMFLYYLVLWQKLF